MKRLMLLSAVALWVGCGSGAGEALSSDRQALTGSLYEISVAAPIPAPGFPEGVAVSRGRAYVTGPAAFDNSGAGPSTVWAFDVDSGALVREYVIQGEYLQYPHGISEVLVDRDGDLYVLSTQLGVLRIDPRSGEQTFYAPPFPDLPSCNWAPAPCSPTAWDRPALPNGAVFDAAGNMYVTDFLQATLWKVPAGGGPASIFFQDPRLDATFGPNGIRLNRSGDTLYFAVTGPEISAIFTLPVQAPAAEDLRIFAMYPYQFPDGIAFGASGNLYVVLSGTNQISILDRSGAEIARFPSPADNAQLPIPLDFPAGIAFDGDSLLITNHAFMSGDPARFALLRAYVGEGGQHLESPDL